MRVHGLLDERVMDTTPSVIDYAPRPIQAASANSLRCPRCHHGLLLNLSVMPDPAPQQWLQCNRCAQIIVRT